MGEKDVNQNFVKKLDAISQDGKYGIKGKYQDFCFRHIMFGLINTLETGRVFQ